MTIDTGRISIRNTLKSGDLGSVAALHGKIYGKEHGFPLGFEVFVMQSIIEFFNQYDPKKDRVWVVEYDGDMIGYLSLMHRSENQAQLRCFILMKEFRGLGIGKQLMQEWIDFFNKKRYNSAYLFTTSGLDPAISLYKRHGFEKISEEVTISFGFPMVEILYRLEKD